MTDQYIDIELDLKTENGTPWATVEFTALVDHNHPLHSDDLDFYISSYWAAETGIYEALTEGQVKALLDYEDEIKQQVRDYLINDMDLYPSPPEYFGHHEYGLER